MWRLTLSGAVFVLSVGAGGLLGGATPSAGASSREQQGGMANQQRPTGCTDPGPPLRRHADRGRKRVSLTFDDGPSTYTPRFLRVLSQMHAVATFFEVGDQVRRRSRDLKAILDEGSEIGNHTLHHAFQGRGDLAETSRLIERASGFQPCLMRPPGGGLVSGLVSAAHGLHMTTVVWDVDPRDWSRPGTGAIFHTVTSHVRPGSIAIMHDGGGNRSETLAALPRIIRNLQQRGYELVTVTQLLGGEMRYPPLLQPSLPAGTP